jgi:hypothetical protein
MASMSSGRDNPFAPPVHQPTEGMVDPTVFPGGSYWLGFAIGFFLGLWGALGCHFWGKALTKRGGLHGFLARFVAVAVVIGIFVLLRNVHV